jgi:hypothetical protein
MLARTVQVRSKPKEKRVGKMLGGFGYMARAGMRGNSGGGAAQRRSENTPGTVMAALDTGHLGYVGLIGFLFNVIAFLAFLAIGVATLPVWLPIVLRKRRAAEVARQRAAEVARQHAVARSALARYRAEQETAYVAAMAAKRVLPVKPAAGPRDWAPPVTGDARDASVRLGV